MNRAADGRDRVAGRLGALCRAHGVARLEVFGSFAAGNADHESDLDVLATFLPNARTGLALVELHKALEELVGRRVDLVTRSSIERSPNRYLRRFVLACTEPLYDCA